FRLRRRLRAANGSASVDAVLRTDGSLVHAEDKAKAPETRRLLRQAVGIVERSRGRLRRSDPEGAVSAWKPLAGTHWSLVDIFETDGRRYVVACENRSRLRSAGALTERETQVIEHLRLGQSTKVVAYTLGISDSTVRVLLA